MGGVIGAWCCRLRCPWASSVGERVAGSVLVLRIAYNAGLKPSVLSRPLRNRLCCPALFELERETACMAYLVGDVIGAILGYPSLRQRFAGRESDKAEGIRGLRNASPDWLLRGFGRINDSTSNIDLTSGPATRVIRWWLHRGFNRCRVAFPSGHSGVSNVDGSRWLGCYWFTGCPAAHSGG